MDTIYAYCFDRHECNGDRSDQWHQLSLPHRSSHRRRYGSFFSPIKFGHASWGCRRSDRPGWHGGQRPSRPFVGGTAFQWGLYNHVLPC